jgi:hypothetical protein
LGRIAEGRNDRLEVSLAGKAWADIPDTELPPCASERAGFMSPHSRRVTKRHPYAAWNEVYRNFQPTEYEVPAYSADCVPFRWMLRDSAVDLADAYRLPYESELEAAIDSEASLNDPSWVQHAKISSCSSTRSFRRQARAQSVLHLREGFMVQALISA